MLNKQPNLEGFHEALRRIVRLTLAVGIVFLPVFITGAAQAQSFSVIYDFSEGGGGETPQAGLIADANGNFYGTAALGGADGYGTVYELPATGGEIALYSFTGGSDGAEPSLTLLRGSGGGLYGVTPAGGNLTGVCAPVGCGVVFGVSPRGLERVLYTFTGGSDGAIPDSVLVSDGAGNLYGTAGAGGSFSGPCSPSGCGLVFEVSKTGGETVLYTFMGGSDGDAPDGGLVRDAAGDLYGTTEGGGNYGYGVVFKLDNAGNQTVLYSFTGGADGANPLSLVQDGAGNLYGVTAVGGDLSCFPPSGCGVVFKVDSAGNETTLHTFTGGMDGSLPGGGLVRAPSGTLYGTTVQGGNGDGTIFEVNSSGVESVLHRFSGTDGQSPQGSLLAYSGYIYGTASGGGSGLGGVAYKLKP